MIKNTTNQNMCFEVQLYQTLQQQNAAGNNILWLLGFPKINVKYFLT